MQDMGDLNNQVIIFPNVTEGEPLKVYSDADWAGGVDTSRSTTGYIVHLWGCISRLV